MLSICLQFLFWCCFSAVVYAYVLYPLLLVFLYVGQQIRADLRYLIRRRDRRTRELADDALPGVSMLIAAYNEEACLPKKIVNIEETDYPSGRLQIVIVSDGSTDRTNEILGGVTNPNFDSLIKPARAGKSNALNDAVEKAKHEILVFSDAATLFEPDTVRKLVRHFQNPRIGVVCGSLQFEGTDESRRTEGVYWSYESMLRLMEGRLGATMTASGALYALRRECYRTLPKDSVLEDFLVPMRARNLGYSVAYDPEAVATEFSASTVGGEFTRRVRLGVGSFRALGELARTKLGGFAILAFTSHKLLRWLVPFFLIGMLVTNIFLRSPLYRLLLAAQITFYFWALIGFLFRARLSKIRFALVGYFLLAMNLAFLVGFFRYLGRRQEATWQKVQ